MHVIKETTVNYDTSWQCLQFDWTELLPARRYASAGNSDCNVSVCVSVCPSVRYAPVLCQNDTASGSPKTLVF